MNNILWCPIDLPKCPVIPSAKTDFVWHFWEVTKLTVNHSNPYEVTDFTEEVKNSHPELVKWFEFFPYKNIRNVKLNHQISLVKRHIDFTKPDMDPLLHENNVVNEPCGYRVLIKGTRKNKLYVVHNGEKIYCEMPEDTDVYVLGHTSTMHGVDDDDDRWTIFTHFEIDELRHKELLQKSLTKYSKYAIIR